MNIDIGQLVYSRAGRDSGRKFVVINIVNENYVLVVDGCLRKLENPKKKNCKHLEITDIILDKINIEIIKNKKINNAEIREILKYNM